MSVELSVKIVKYLDSLNLNVYGFIPTVEEKLSIPEMKVIGKFMQSINSAPHMKYLHNCGTAVIQKERLSNEFVEDITKMIKYLKEQGVGEDSCGVWNLSDTCSVGLCSFTYGPERQQHKKTKICVVILFIDNDPETKKLAAVNKAIVFYPNKRVNKKYDMTLFG